jgi:hypothetical protein
MQRCIALKDLNHLVDILMPVLNFQQLFQSYLNLSKQNLKLLYRLNITQKQIQPN